MPLKTARGNLYFIFLNSAFSLDILSIFIKLVGNVFMISAREACIKILIKILLIFLCYIGLQIMKTMIYILGHKNTTRT